MGPLFRSLFPSWRFFDRPGPALCFEIRSPAPEAPWVPVLTPRRDWPMALVHSPRTNAALAFASQVQRLLDDAHNLGPKVEDSISYRIVRAWARARCAPGTTYQFSIVVREDGDEERVLVSKVELA